MPAHCKQCNLSPIISLVQTIARIKSGFNEEGKAIIETASERQVGDRLSWNIHERARISDLLTDSSIKFEYQDKVLEST